MGVGGVAEPFYTISQLGKLRCQYPVPILVVTVVFWEIHLLVVAVVAPWKVNNGGGVSAGHRSSRGLPTPTEAIWATH